MKIKGLNKVAKASQSIVQSDWRTWIDIYYDMKTNTVMLEQDKEKATDKSQIWSVTQLIRPNTAKEIEQAITRCLYI